ncbi:hypothetical protein DJ568_15440 [Mucilaginibacter hurinus]|uniref:Uncharacterized protein n=1 Tax=Mucilaginibacter hurinus TaxID=2201324 RepID=A0A367GML8_9SPHI|nr:hypothetical protein [Mucilaginibacter hurinus]RCH53931.1 hypothetical protein DJ568_15440 [Mucilaginibacter hurinus]
MKFILTYILTFLGLSLMMCLASGSVEWLAYIIFFNALYAIISGITWLAVNQVIKSNKLYWVFFKLLFGLTILNIFIYVFTGNIPTILLLGIGDNGMNWSDSFFLHVIYILSFAVAISNKQKLATLVK